MGELTATVKAPTPDLRRGIRAGDASRDRVRAALRHTDRWWRTADIRAALRRGGRTPSLRLVQAVLRSLAVAGIIQRRDVNRPARGGTKFAEWRWIPGVT